MAHKILKHRIYAPIFDRFIDTNPDIVDECLNDLVLGPESLKKSIFDWLNIVLNTRPTAKDYLSSYGQRDTTVEKLPVYFGLSDFSWFNTTQHLNFGTIIEVIEKIISQYEPRLIDVRVIILNKDLLIRDLSIRINAKIKMANDLAPFSCPIIIDNFFKRP